MGRQIHGNLTHYSVLHYLQSIILPVSQLKSPSIPCTEIAEEGQALSVTNAGVSDCPPQFLNFSMIEENLFNYFPMFPLQYKSLAFLLLHILFPSFLFMHVQLSVSGFPTDHICVLGSTSSCHFSPGCTPHLSYMIYSCNVFMHISRLASKACSLQSSDG